MVPKRFIIASIVTSGIVAIVSQIVFMRELLVVFYGNEISIAFILACWLIGGAIGSAGFGRFADYIAERFRALVLCQLLLAVITPATLILIRSIKHILHINPGEVVPIFPMIASSFAVVVPICTILGFVFALSCRIYADSRNKAIGVTNVYILESIGAMFAGICVTCFVIRFAGSLSILLALSSLLCAMAILVCLRSSHYRGRILILSLAAIMFSGCALLLFSGLSSRVEKKLIKRQWCGYDLLSSRNSIYGNIAITKSRSQYSFFDNGLHLYTIPDAISSEESVHYAMLEHQNPKMVLCIGGGIGGILKEILKHPVERVDYVDLDPTIVHMSEEYLPPELFAPMRDPRVTFISEDGRLYVKSTEYKYDVVIMNIGEPYTAQLNRFYTMEFFSEVQAILNKGGILSFGLTSSESYMSNEQKAFLRTIHDTLRSVFNDAIIIPGETAYFIAAEAPDTLTYDYNILMERALARGVKLKYVREYYLVSKLSPEMVDYIQRSITSKVGPEEIEPTVSSRGINKDFRPVSYYFDMVFWSARFKDSLFNKILKSVDHLYVWAGVWLFSILLLIIGCIHIHRGMVSRSAVMSIFVNGLSQISLQVLILLAFQIIYGYMFYKLGLIITLYMAGIALGGYSGVRILRTGSSGYRELLYAQTGLFLMSIFLPVIFFAMSKISGSEISWIGSNVIFVLLSLLCGIIGGLIFPFVNKVYMANNDRVGLSGGLIYGIDLLGACVGAVLTGIFLVPILGLYGTSVSLAVFNFAVIMVLLSGYMRSKKGVISKG